MMSRCYDRTSPAFKDYGGRGITVCQEWHDIHTFAAWVAGSGYDDCLTIDRINNDAGYNPENCRWATAKQQCENRRLRRDAVLDANKARWAKALLSAGCPGDEISRMLGCSQQQICNIKNGRSWVNA
jgi:hypothetical protein